MRILGSVRLKTSVQKFWPGNIEIEIEKTPKYDSQTNRSTQKLYAR